ncbi:AsmA family protein [Kangiella geojedonensis]|uniref:AsmA family protein n=1 Tax=Kangiella geojedonensis TaxID=914150 RepID=A0A0F6RCX8_9GAMM|nr:AsmA family protein [Kangiella geojedonensis]AKE52813.1 AsmA family protein [Kangiella geojedonensis]
MKRIFKWILGLLGTLVALILVLGIVAVIFFNSDELKNQIVKTVKAETTADLVIEQELSLGFFPWLQVETGGVTLSQPATFKSDKQLLKVEQVSASIKLMPLLSGDIEVGSVELSGAELNLLRDKSGRSNIEALVNAKDKKPAANEGETDSSSQPGALSLDSLSLKDFTLNQYDYNQQLSQSFRLTSLEVSDFEPETLTPVTAEGSLQAGNSQSEWGLSGDLWVGSNFKQFKVSQLDAELEGLSKQLQNIGLTGDLELSMEDKTTKLSHKGKIDLNGQPIDFQLNAGFSTFKDIDVKLSTERLQLENFLAATGGEKAPTQSGGLDLSPVADFLKRARVKGQLDVGELILKNATFSNVSANLRNKGSTLFLDPFKADAFQGHMETIASVNFASQPLALSVQPDFDNIQIGDLLVAFFELDKLSGLGELDLNMKTKGADVKQMLQNLNGTGNLTLSDGAFNGIDIEKLIQSGLSLQSLNKDNYSGKTSFANLSSNIKANQGFIEMPDFKLNSPVFDLTGKASTNANKETLAGNFQLVLKGKIKEAMEAKYPKLKGKKLPFELKGTWTEPKASIDIEALLKAEYQGKIDEKKKELEDKAKDELKDKLGDLFNRKKDTDQ